MAELEPLIPVSTTSNWINTISAFIGLVHNTFLFFHVYYKNQKQGKELANINPLQQPLYIGALITYSSFVLYNITTICVTVKPIYELMTCTAVVTFSVIAYSFGRYCVWLFSLLRIYIVFHSKILVSLGYKKTTLLCATIIFTIFIIAFVVNALFAIKGNEIFIDKYNSFCTYTIHPFWPFMIMNMLDQWCTISCFVLFWKKMRLLNKLKHDDKLVVYILRKYTILMGTNLLSTWLLMTLIMLTPLGVLAGALDGAINMWTIVLFDKKYDKYYQKIFCCFIHPLNEEKQLANYVGNSNSSAQSSGSQIKPSVISTDLEFSSNSNNNNKDNAVIDVAVSTNSDVVAYIH